MVEYFHGMSSPSQLLNPFNLYGLQLLGSTKVQCWPFEFIIKEPILSYIQFLLVTN